MKKHLYKLAVTDMILLSISFMCVLFSIWFKTTPTHLIYIIRLFNHYRFIPITASLIPFALILYHIYIIVQIIKDNSGNGADIINENSFFGNGKGENNNESVNSWQSIN